MLLYKEFYDTLMILTELIATADTATILDWSKMGYVIFATTFFGIFPLASILLAILTSTVLFLLCRDKRRSYLRRRLGLVNAEAPRSGKGLEFFLTKTRADLPHSLVLLLIVGLVPFLGVAIGIIYYWVSPVASLRRRIAASDLGFLLLVLPMAALALVALQPVPVVGPLSLPLLYAILHAVYDTILRRRYLSSDAVSAQQRTDIELQDLPGTT